MERYERQLMLDDFDRECQRKLEASTVAVVGAGALGSPALFYLAAAGVGHLRVIDNDVVNESNLQRQILHDTPSLGCLKTSNAKRRLEALNPAVKVDERSDRLTPTNVSILLDGADVVIDAVDNYPTKLLLNDYCVAHDTPLIYGGIQGYAGQLMAIRRGTANLRTLFGTAPTQSAPVAVLGPVAGVIGSLQAAEAIKILTGIGSPIFNAMTVYDARLGSFRRITL